MASNSFGTQFRITTWGESHGKAYGVVIDGCPAGLELSEKEITDVLLYRRPGRNIHTTPRKELDIAHIYSGVFEGKTTGAPISILILNEDNNPEDYIPIKKLLRPGHASFTYWKKYTHFDPYGGGRASARETVCRVAAGAIAKKILHLCSIDLIAYIRSVGDIVSPSYINYDINEIRHQILNSPIFCPCPETQKKISQLLDAIKSKGDSIGGVVELFTTPLPIGLGDPVYERLEANLAKSMLSIPACKGFEIGDGFLCTRKLGSESNDQLYIDNLGNISFITNYSGGTLGGITNGMPLYCRMPFKPTSSIQKPQHTVNFVEKVPSILHYTTTARHDPCVAIRAVPVVEAMAALVLVDALLLNQSIDITTIISRMYDTANREKVTNNNIPSLRQI